MSTLIVTVSESVAERARRLPNADQFLTALVTGAVEAIDSLSPERDDHFEISPARRGIESIPSEVLTELRSHSAEQAKRSEELFAKWAEEPEDPAEPTLEELMEGINENRRQTGERLIY